MSKFIKKFNEYIKENHTISDLQYIETTLDETLDISGSEITFNGKLITHLSSTDIETEDGEFYELGALDADTLSELRLEVENWDIDNQKSYKRAGIDDDDRAWNSSDEDEDDFDDEDEEDEEIVLEHIADLILQGYTSGYNPSWKLETEIFEDGFELGDTDLEHIASQVKIGMNQGELNVSAEDSDDTSRGWWKLIR